MRKKWHDKNPTYWSVTECSVHQAGLYIYKNVQNEHYQTVACDASQQKTIRLIITYRPLHWLSMWISLSSSSQVFLFFTHLWLGVCSTVSTTRSELHKVLFLGTVCDFLFFSWLCTISWELLNGFVPNSHRRRIGPSPGRVWRSRSKVEITRDKKQHFCSFGGRHAVCVW